jgi:hypothetical protein
MAADGRTVMLRRRLFSACALDPHEKSPKPVDGCPEFRLRGETGAATSGARRPLSSEVSR